MDTALRCIIGDNCPIIWFALLHLISIDHVLVYHQKKREKGSLLVEVIRIQEFCIKATAIVN
jgi:tryptophan-rich sensory protein